MKPNKRESTWLLGLARQSIEHFLETKDFLPIEKFVIPDEYKEIFTTLSPAFVVLVVTKNEHRKAQVRGSNGVFDKVEPLAKLVTQLSVNAAFFDTTSPRLKPYELNELVIYLLIPQKLERVSGTYAEILSKLDDESVGVLLETRGRRAFDLPSMVGEKINAEQRIRRLRLQLGIRRKASETDVEYYKFSVHVISEIDSL